MLLNLLLHLLELLQCVFIKIIGWIAINEIISTRQCNKKERLWIYKGAGKNFK